VKKKKILFLLPYPLNNAPSQRFRIEAYFPLLKEQDFEIDTQSFFDENSWRILYKSGSVFQKSLAVVKGFLKRTWAALFLVHRYDFVVVHREAAPIGPPVFEWMIARLWRKKMIFDFDDAIWIPAISDNNRIAGYIKCFWKTRSICKWSYKIAAGNQYLQNFAKQYNHSVVIIPTAVDTHNRYNYLVDQNIGKPSIGWTGSHSTVKYLDAIYPVLQKLDEAYDFDFIVICNKPANFQLKNSRYIEWKAGSEITDLTKINIGLMPLEPDEWSEGKCGFKVIQYLSLGIPAVASPVGVNKQIVDERINGFLCSTDNEWYEALSILLQNSQLRTELGRKGREKIMSAYSIHANEPAFLNLFT
jgi:glycosyltransferase involved in cell wall biosynthesis